MIVTCMVNLPIYNCLFRMSVDRETLIHAPGTCDEVRTEAIRGMISLAIGEMEVSIFPHRTPAHPPHQHSLYHYFSVFKFGLMKLMVTFINCTVGWLNCVACCAYGSGQKPRRFCQKVLLRL